MPFRVRTATIEDKATVSRLLLTSYTALLRDAYDPATLEQALPLITSAQSGLLTSGSYYVAETDDGKIVGAGGWTRNSPTGQNQTASNGHIRHFGTDPGYTGQGVGRAIMDRCVEDARQCGVSEFNCYSTLNGEGFYAACGFESIEPFLITLPGDVPFPAIRMIRPL